MNITIPFEVQEHIQQRMGGAAEIRLMAACRIWVERKGKWSYCNLQGGLALAFDPNIISLNNSMNRDDSMINNSGHGCHVFYLFDMKTFDVTFRLYLYRNFHSFYKKLNPHFYYFRMPKTQSLFGFSFSNSDEAKLLEDELRYLGANEKQQHEMELMHNPALIAEQQLIEDFENDRPVEPIINLQYEKDRIEKAKLSKVEKDILKNAGISKSMFKQDAATRALIVSKFIHVIQEKKVQHEIKLHNSANQQPQAQTNPEAEFQLMRRATNVSVAQVSQQQQQQQQQQQPLQGQASNMHASVAPNHNQIGSHVRSPNMIKSIAVHSQIPSAPPLQKLLENEYISPSLQQQQQQLMHPINHNNNNNFDLNNNNNNHQSVIGNLHHTPKTVIPEVKHSLLDEIRNKNYQLNPVAKTNNPVDFTKEEGISLTQQINAQMRERRKQIKKNHIEDFEESSPWDSLDEGDD